MGYALALESPFRRFPSLFLQLLPIYNLLSKNKSKTKKGKKEGKIAKKITVKSKLRIHTNGMWITSYTYHDSPTLMLDITPVLKTANGRKIIGQYKASLTYHSSNYASDSITGKYGKFNHHIG